MITVVGHADLEPESLAVVEAHLCSALEALPPHAVGLVRAGAGAPVAFGRALAAAGRRLIAVLPVRDGLMSPMPGCDVEAAQELVHGCMCARLLPFDPADRSSRITTDEQLVMESRHVLAVWDGSPTDGRDATAHLVAYARARGIPVDVVWPPGAARTGMPGAPSTAPR